MKYRFSKEIYQKEALIKAAYRYTDKAYIHLDADENNFYVDIEAKSQENHITEKEFKNAILAEMVRLYISDRTKNVRELILARAFSSTIIEKDDLEPPPENDYNIANILTDWFDEYDDTEAM
ncbi:MAG: His-Xaa-Ser system protein HxsD [Clostridia bacterium]|nr:His-Xaa-Ser system protein HxsD [Clostridia bacterium]